MGSILDFSLDEDKEQSALCNLHSVDRRLDDCNVVWAVSQHRLPLTCTVVTVFKTMLLSEPLRRPQATTLYTTTSWRWFILFYFSLSNCNQCLAWFSFSSFSQQSMAEYFGSAMTATTIGVFLNWGPLIGILFFPVQTWIVSQKNGLQKGIWCGLILNIVGNVIRSVPIVMKESGWRPGFASTTTAYVCYHTGQIFIAAAGPFFMGTVTKLSCTWFAQNERTSVTAIATTANGLGTTIGFLNPQWLSIPSIFYVSLVLSVVAIVCGMIHLPPLPPSPPSAAAAAALFDVATNATNVTIDAARGYENPEDIEDVEEMKTQWDLSKHNDPSENRSSWCDTIKAASGDRSFVLLVVAAAVLAGVNSGWQGLLQLILAPAGIDQAKVGFIGFGNAAAGNMAAVLAGTIMDRCFKRKLKLGIVLGLLGTFITTLWFTLQLPCAWWGGGEQDGVLPRSEFTLVLALTLAGMFQGATSPLFYELAAELIYPVKEGMSAGILVLLLNVSAAIMIFIQNVLSGGTMNVIITGSTLFVLLLVLVCVRENYGRPQNQ